MITLINHAYKRKGRSIEIYDHQLIHVDTSPEYTFQDISKAAETDSELLFLIMGLGLHTSAYNVFYLEISATMEPTLSISERSRVISRRWHGIVENEKRPYFKKSDESQVFIVWN